MAEGDDTDKPVDDDAVAAEWAKMAEAEQPADDAFAAAPAAGAGAMPNPPGQSTRVLNQDEIDSLLGFDSADEQDKDRSGIKAIINSAFVSYERLPMLEVVFDRLVRMMT